MNKQFRIKKTPKLTETFFLPASLESELALLGCLRLCDLCTLGCFLALDSLTARRSDLPLNNYIIII